MPKGTDDDILLMRRALQLAACGQGFVEPNPLVGSVLVRDGIVLGEGYHERYGEDHAEVNALRHAGDQARGATLYVTLEPCCHFGKTAPCTDAIVRAGISRVVIAMRDPFPKVDGGGLACLHGSGVSVTLGVLEDEAKKLNRPYLTLLAKERPWVIAKWAMTLDGKTASHSGSSFWISNSRSRQLVHDLRGRVDAIIVGRNTAIQDDPLLTARPPGPRLATRVVIDREASLPLDSQLVKTAGQVPLIVVTGPATISARAQALQEAGAEVLPIDVDERGIRIDALLKNLGQRRWTNVLLEGGGTLTGAFWDAGLIDEVHTFVAPKVIGGRAAPSPVAGIGRSEMNDAIPLDDLEVASLDGDLHVHGFPRWDADATSES